MASSDQYTGRAVPSGSQILRCSCMYNSCALWQFTTEALVSLEILLWQEPLYTPLIAVCTFNTMPSGLDFITDYS